jgi:uncharacterized membrane protein YkoI
MKRHKKLLIGAATVLVVGAAGAGVAVATSDDDASDTPISGPALERASQVARDHVGGGTVTGTEVDDEESYYEVEVTLDDGSQVDVQLDRDFDVVGDEADSENEPDDG